MSESFSFGYWLKRQRLARDLRQAALAQQLGIAAITLRKIEADERRPSLQLIEQLAVVFALDAAERLALLRVARADLDPAALSLPSHAYAVGLAAPQALTAPLPPDESLALPASAALGTFTFLFVDLASSTERWDATGQAMGAAVAHNSALISDAVADHGGHIFQRLGDTICAAFATAEAALAAALAAQRACAPAHGDAAPPARMALHTGAATSSAGTYFGPPLNRVAALLAAAHPGQTLLSLAVVELVRDRLPAELRLHDLGAHRLRDLTRPEQVFQLVAPDLPAAFPALLSLAALRHNLPVAPTPLLGRTHELATVGALLRDDAIRLVTLIGPGGIGKTRLALQAAADTLGTLPDGAWFVDLAPLHDPALVLVTLAQTLGVREGGGLLRTQLADYLREKRLLLLLDNCEQVLAAAPELAALLAAAPGVKILATSRAALHLAGEHEYAVPPLSLPAPGVLSTVEQLTQYEAVRLFIVRARAVRATFAVTSANAPAVAEICHWLDGMPLAIELAAARLRLFAPEALLARLADRRHGAPLHLLAGGPRDMPTRQQTLRSTIDWSYNLLAPPEQRLFAYLGVFSGGCDLESAEAVCGIRLGADILAGLEALAAQSLLRVSDGPGGEPRFGMLETIQAYAGERLEASNEAEAVRDAHAAYFVGLAEAAEPALRGPQSIVWLKRIELEHSNLRVALDRLLAQGDYARLARACYALWRFWFNHGTWGEARPWLEATIDERQAADLPPVLRGRALLAAGMTLAMQSDFARALAYCEESLMLLRQAGDQVCLSDALEGITHAKWGLSDRVGTTAAIAEAVALDRAHGDRYRLAWHLEIHAFAAFVGGDMRSARARATESLALCQELGIQDKTAWVLIEFAIYEKTDGNYPRAETLLAEALAISQVAGDRYNSASALNYMSQVCIAQGQYERAEVLAAESLALRRELGDRRGAVALCGVLADAVRGRGDLVRAQTFIAEGLRLARELGGYQQGYSWHLRGAALLALALQQPERAARLLGADAARREAHAILIWPDERAEYEQLGADTRAALSSEAYAAAWAIGQAFSLEQALAEALESP